MILRLWLLTICFLSTCVYAQTYFDGRWDSTLYNLSEHPHTIALRVLVEDSDTRLPLSGVEVQLEGEYEEATQFGASPVREFRLRAVTGRDGVAVFGLLWHAEFQTDDIDKVQRMSARKAGYRFAQKSLNFDQLERSNPRYSPDEWKNLIRETPGAKYFLPVIGARFNDYNNRACTRVEFFRLVRDEDYGAVFRARDDTGADFPNIFTTSNPQREAGPFMVLPLTFRLSRVFDEHRVTIEGRHSTPRPWVEDREPEDAPPRERRRQGSRDERDKRVWERYGDGHISEHQYRNIGSYINSGMSRTQVIDVLGPPARQSVSATGNTVMHWFSWENSGHGIMVVINKKELVTRVKQD